MPRHTADRLLQRVASDPGFRLLPEALQLMWFQLLAWSAGAADKGCVRFPVSVAAAVSRLFSISETQAETQLETLANLMLLEIDEDGCSVWMPGARFSAERAQAAKLNGLRGGRPRKGESLEQYRTRRERERDDSRRQGHLIMPLAGGLTETQETQQEPTAESSRATTTTTFQDSLKRSGSTVREDTELGLLETQLLAAARVESGRLSPEPLRHWLVRGVAPALLQRVVSQVASRSSYQPSKVSSWAYFTPAITEALELPQALSKAGSETSATEPALPTVPMPLEPSCDLPGAEPAWMAVHEDLHSRLGSTAYRAWISRLVLTDLQDGLALLTVSSRFLRDRVETDYGPTLRAALQQHLAGCQGYQLLVADERQRRTA